ncbi:MAG: hypothetical protein KJ607_14795, partial [Bacteroidetes bacterium]|nr:hypothetical protein [Bacteroidota bacterium]
VVKKAIYSNGSILNRAFPNVKLGVKEALFYFTLNKGYQKRNNIKAKDAVQRNKYNLPVDFDVTKYVTPVKSTVFTF